MIPGGPDESDTCRDYVGPALLRAGWPDDQVREQYPVQADLAGRLPSNANRKRRADYVLELESGLPLMVIEAKRLGVLPGDGIQQAARYADMLGVPFALSTNGAGWVLYHAVTGVQQSVDDVPTPVEAWDLLVSSRAPARPAQDYLLALSTVSIRTLTAASRLCGATSGEPSMKCSARWRAASGGSCW